MRRVAILGGGIAGLTAAWHLSGADCRDNLEVTVYQRGWRLGGKGASSRGAHGRIEEHGLHVWLGYYDNAFRLVRDVYGELDRRRTDPDCPIRGWEDAFSPADEVGVEERFSGTWSHWIATFQRHSGEPGGPHAGQDAPTSVVRFVQRGLGLLLDFAASLPDDGSDQQPVGVALSASSVPPRRPSRSRDRPGIAQLLRQAEVAALVGSVEMLRLVGTVPSAAASLDFVLSRLDGLRRELATGLQRNADTRRTGQLANLVLTCIQGVIRDGLLTDPRGFSAIDSVDFRDWLRRHGAGEETCQSPLVRGMYDLVFAYEQGDTDRPQFAAGVGLYLAGKLFFDYRGSIFWHLNAGMGDVVFAPLYQALTARGVRFRFFHRVDQLHLSADHRRIAAITLGQQAQVADPQADYQPLVRVGNLPCYPAAPRTEQLVGRVPLDLECHWSDRTAEQKIQLRAGVDFDVTVLAVSIGMIRHVCPELIADSPRWREMVDRIATVPTQSLQVWMRKPESELGWRHPGATVSGYGAPFDTYASMSHLIRRESWPDSEGVRSLGYFCSVLPKESDGDHVAADAIVRAHAVDFLSRHVAHFWPSARSADGDFCWDLLAAAGEKRGPDRLDGQYWRANVDPSDQYVQCLPGTVASRLRADESGYQDLYLAGDWTNTGLNAGCIEAAVMSGRQAANAVRGEPLMRGVLGGWRVTP